MSEHETNFVCSDMQKRLFPSNSLQTGVLPIEQKTVALSLGSLPQNSYAGREGKSPGTDAWQNQDVLSSTVNIRCSMPAQVCCDTRTAASLHLSSSRLADR